MSSRRLLLALALSSLPAFAAEVPVRPVPPPGIQVPETDAKELESGIKALGEQIDALRSALKSKPELLALLPDVQIFHKSADWALRYGEFFDPKQIAIAKAHLAQGQQRAQELKAGTPSWNSATGLVVRGYVSKIDGSIQPYGLVIPEDWKPGETKARRLDFWMHGRGEKLSELDFVEQRNKQKGEFTPEGAFVLHLYGRYCCANKFAGETDLFEALGNARSHYNVDENRLVVRGFSMGGGSCWQFATHFGSLWAAAAPGAGFGESKEFMRLGSTPDKPLPPLWEQTLWRWYDSTVYAGNLANCPTVAYSGEKDGQKQAADIMIRFLEQEGLSIPHIIGPDTAHKYHPDSKPKIEEFLAKATQERQPVPEKLRFTTYTLVYPRMSWVQVDGMEQQWERADVEASLAKDSVTATTKNVRAISFRFPDSKAPGKTLAAQIDGQKLSAPYSNGAALFHKSGSQWKAGAAPEAGKQPGLCGPIDHAFMSSFIMVRPTGKPLNDKVGTWAKDELEHATTFWRRVFRGDAPIKDDKAISAEDIANSNLILWGDPSSNAVLAKILPKLPLQWSATTLTFGGSKYDPTHQAPVLIFPNPLNPKKYVVINSGVTFREEALLNNANQIPKLPDWAIVDLDTAPNPRSPGQILTAGFFDDAWKVPAK